MGRGGTRRLVGLSCVVITQRTNLCRKCYRAEIRKKRSPQNFFENPQEIPCVGFAPSADGATAGKEVARGSGVHVQLTSAQNQRGPDRSRISLPCPDAPASPRHLHSASLRRSFRQSMAAIGRTLIGGPNLPSSCARVLSSRPHRLFESDVPLSIVSAAPLSDWVDGTVKLCGDRSRCRRIAEV